MLPFIKNNKVILLSLLVILIYLSPNIFVPHQAKYLIHDNLDSNPVWYKNLAESGKMFASSKEIVPNSLGGIPRGCYPSQFNLLYLFYLWFPALFAYNLNIVLMHLIAFFSMYIFSRKYIFKGKFDTLTAGVSLCFALLPFWPSGALSIAGQPLLLYAFLNILNKDLSMKNWLIIIFIPFYSVLVFSNLFLCIVLFILFIFYSIYKKQVNYYFIAAIALFALISMLVDYRLFIMQFVEHFESHRSVLVKTATLNFKGVVGVSLLHFLFGQYHFLSLQFPVILILSLMALFLTKERNKRFRLLALLFGAYCISLSYVLPDWKLADELMNKFSILKVFGLRFYSLFPLIWIIIFAYSCYLLLESKLIFQKILPYFILAFSIFAFFGLNSKDYYNSDFGENTFYRTYINKKNEGFATFDEYYKIPVFNEVKKKLSPGPYYVGCIGIDPEVAQYNGFNTIDGYFFYYSKKHNELMNTISKKEMEKTGRATLGSRCYLVSDDVEKGKNEITNLELDFEKMKTIGTRYIISDRKIINENLTDEQVFNTTDLKDILFIYTIKS